MRSPKKRSLLGVNEHFEGEYNAEITLLDNYFVYLMGKYLTKLFLSLLIGKARGSWIFELIKLFDSIFDIAKEHICHIAGHTLTHNNSHNYHIFDSLRHCICRNHPATLLQSCLKVIECPLCRLVVLRLHIPYKERIIALL